MRILRQVSAAAVLACFLMAPAVQAETVDQRAQRCAAQSVIVAKAVEHRLKKRSQKRADKLVRRFKDIKGGPYERHVDLLVNWVYTLPEAQLGPDVHTAFETACTNYEG